MFFNMELRKFLKETGSTPSVTYFLYTRPCWSRYSNCTIFLNIIWTSLAVSQEKWGSPWACSQPKLRDSHHLLGLEKVFVVHMYDTHVANRATSFTFLCNKRRHILLFRNGFATQVWPERVERLALWGARTAACCRQCQTVEPGVSKPCTPAGTSLHHFWRIGRCQSTRFRPWTWLRMSSCHGWIQWSRAVNTVSSYLLM